MIDYHYIIIFTIIPLSRGFTANISQHGDQKTQHVMRTFHKVYHGKSLELLSFGWGKVEISH